MSEVIRVRVPAKINLYLAVGPKRADGYHDLVTVFQAISLYDELAVRQGDGFSLVVRGEGAEFLPTGEENLAVRAARLLAERAGVRRGAELVLDKGIPVAGGMAGGSADAAAVLLGCDALWGTGLDRAALRGLAAELGSDTAFPLLGGTAVGTGRGEVLTAVPTAGRWHWVVALARGGLSTPRVYAELDRLRELRHPPSLDNHEAVLAALRQSEPEYLAKALGNDMQAAALSLRPDLRKTLHAGEQAGALAAMVSGSGPSCLFLAASAGHAESLAATLESGSSCRAVRVASSPVDGAEILD
jgi:4-diphosphocytidyl-2-C-methyl-D-erythritol kinase